jgi:hypothetical protein
MEPELLIWENFGVSWFSRLFRSAFYIIFIIAMLIICFITIFELSQLVEDASIKIPDIQCQKVVDGSAANLDYYAAYTVRNGDFHCFCKNMLQKEGFSGIDKFQFPLD